MRVRLFPVVLFLLGVSVVVAGLTVGSVANAADPSTQLWTDKKPSIVFILAGNLGSGKTDSYGDGILC